MFASSLVLACGLTAGQPCRGPGEGVVLVHRLACVRTARGGQRQGQPWRAARGGFNVQGSLLTSLQWPIDRPILHLPPEC